MRVEWSGGLPPEGPPEAAVPLENQRASIWSPTVSPPAPGESPAGWSGRSPTMSTGIWWARVTTAGLAREGQGISHKASVDQSEAGQC